MAVAPHTVSLQAIRAMLAYAPIRRRQKHVALPPIPPRVQDWKAYDGRLRREILNPLQRAIRDRVRLARDDYEAIRRSLDTIQRLPGITQATQSAAQAMASRLQAYHKMKFTKQMRQHLGIDIRPIMRSKALNPTIKAFIEANVSLIRTIPVRHHASLVRELTKLARSNKAFSRTDIEKILTKSYNVSGFNMRRIARDQNAKLMSQITEIRQQQLGITHYKWRSTGDLRVRPTHRNNNGLIFEWAHPPATTGHPGDDINCRCTSMAMIPVLPPAARRRPRKRP